MALSQAVLSQVVLIQVALTQVALKAKRVGKGRHPKMNYQCCFQES